MRESGGCTPVHRSLREVVILACGLRADVGASLYGSHVDDGGRHLDDELIQIDGCLHRWFEARGSQCTALVFVDDVTGRPMELHFVRSDSSFGYFEATRNYLHRHGPSPSWHWPLGLAPDTATHCLTRACRRWVARAVHL